MIPFYLRKTTNWHVGFSMGIEWLQFGSWGAQYGVGRKDHCSLDKVLQFPNISRPTVSNKRIHRFGRNFVDSLVHSPCVKFSEMADQFRNVFSTLPQGGNIDRKHFQPIVQVLAKRCLLYHSGQIAMGGR